MKIFITGCAGFIGSHLCEFLVSENTIVGIDDFSSGSMNNMISFYENTNFTFINSRLQNNLNLDEIISSVDIVLHLAATVGIFKIYKSPLEAMENNVSSSDIIIKSCLKNNVKLVYISSSEIYGKQSIESISEDSNTTFENIISIRSSYSISKITDEIKINILKSQGLKCIVTRLFNVVGPNQTSKYGMVVPRFVKQAMSGDGITIYGDGNQIRTFCDIRDVVSAFNLIIQHSDFKYQVYNIGGFNEIKINNLANLVLNTTQSKSQKIYLPYSDIHTEYDEIYYRKPNTSKFQNAFNWSAKYDNIDIIKYILERNYNSNA